ncbi:MAG: hypothetical protein NTW84_03350 [Methanothrix sp.]|nr:hypothetical protein [Methanothrix sp.]
MSYHHRMQQNTALDALLRQPPSAQGLNNCGCNKGVVGKEIRCSIFKADVERRLVYSVIAKARYRRYSGRCDERGDH